MTDSFKKIINICDDNNIEYEIESNSKIRSRDKLKIRIKKGRDHTNIYIRVGRIADKFIITNNFYEYRFVSGYDAIWSSKNKIIECQIDCPPFLGHWEKRLLKLIGDDDSSDENIVIKIPHSKYDIEISQCTDIFSHFSQFKDQWLFLGGRNYHRTTLKIKKIPVKTHKEALDAIKGLMSTICFQLDISTSLPLQLIAEKNVISRKRQRSNVTKIKMPNLEHKYNVEALSLYWNARSLQGMPLGQYLAFYQTIEFYYTIYANYDAQFRIRNLLKDPSFDVSNEKDISKILNVVKYNKSSNTFGNELEQLKATLNHCIDAQDIQEFFDTEAFDENIFTNKNSKKLADSPINIQFNNTASLFSEVAKRIYKIRCRIVHTKGVEDNVETLHPLSDEVRYITADLKLIEFLAKKILIVTSQPL